jgi:AcrR family transcriptional regulator
VVSLTAEAKPSAARARILGTADRLFYSEGIRAVGVDKVIAEAQVTRATFYRHFPSKDDLVVAYLTARSRREQDLFASARTALPNDPRAVLRALVADLLEEARTPGFRGCAYINAAAEYPDPMHPVRQVIAAHRAWGRNLMAELLTELHHPATDIAADQMVMLYDGARVGAYLDDPDRVADAVVAAGRAVIGDLSPQPPQQDDLDVPVKGDRQGIRETSAEAI